MNTDVDNSATAPLAPTQQLFEHKHIQAKSKKKFAFTILLLHPVRKKEATVF